MRTAASPPVHRPQRSAPAAALRLWPAHERTIGPARHWLIRTLADWKMDEFTDAAALVFSELLTNAVQHARPADGGVVGTEIGTRFVRLESGLRIEVHDASEHPPEIHAHPAESLDERGRGLVLVNALTGGQWGVSERDGIGKCVWAHLSSSHVEAAR